MSQLLDLERYNRALLAVSIDGLVGLDAIGGVCAAPVPQADSGAVQPIETIVDAGGAQRRHEFSDAVAEFREPLLRVAPGELTCRRCGETYPSSWGICPHCGASAKHAVPTVSYLQSGKYC